MSEANPARRNVWPLTLLSLLAGLLTTFILLRILRPDPDGPKEPTTATPTPVATDPDPRAQVAETLLEEARKSLDAGRLKEAADQIRKVRELKDSPEAQELERLIAQVTEKRTREERDRLEGQLSQLRRRVETLKNENRWEAAVKAVEDAAELQEHPDYAALRRNTEQLRREAERSYRLGLDEAAAARAARKYSAAREKAVQAARLCPERKEAAEFLSELEKEIQTANMVRIPPPPAGHTARLGDSMRPDEPAREYAGPGFLIDRYEVTNEDYLIFIEATGHRPPRSSHWDGRRIRSGKSQYPVVGVTASDAEAFAKWADKRLPTEDEWEYAARSLDGRLYPWGDAFTVQENAFLCNSFECATFNKAMESLPVGSFPAGRSPLDVLDLAGNVWEWTATSVSAGEGTAPRRVLKGGSFMTRAEACRASNRFLDDPELAHPDVGFRCVRDLPR